MRIKAYYDKANNWRVLACLDAFEKKETLKALGFEWNPFRKEWFKKYSSFVELATYIVDVMVECDLPYEVFEDTYDASYPEMQHLDDSAVYTAESLAKWNAKYGE